jgi:PAS domain S-box-containing protein
MARQVNQMAADIHGSQGHITSLNPLRPGNIPDSWEAAALKSFEGGIKEVSSVEKIAGEEYMRLMRPFITEEACLKCHASQGYKEGDVRGGISVSIPMAPLWAIERPLIAEISLAHLLLWMVGIGGIVISKRGLEKEILARQKAETVLSESADKLRIVADFTYDWEYWRSPDDRFLYVSPSCERITGYPREEFIQDPGLYFRIIHPDDRERVAVHLREDQFRRELGELEFRIVRRDGQERWIGHACQPVVDANGQSLGRRASDRDITERKRAEGGLK